MNNSTLLESTRPLFCYISLRWHLNVLDKSGVDYTQVHMKLLIMAFLLCTVSGKAQEGWRSLFDGRTLEGWMWSTLAKPPPPSWAVADGLLQTTPGQGQPVYLITRESFADFDFSFEWKTEAGGNSGVKYRFQGYWVDGKNRPAPEGQTIEPIALEYQLADDEHNPDAVGDVKRSTASIYAYWAPKKDGPTRAGVWHSSRIVTRGTHIEHWLDGRKVVDVDLDSTELQKAFQESNRKGPLRIGAPDRGREGPLLARQERRDSPIALQFHGRTVWFRNLKIRR